MTDDKQKKLLLYKEVIFIASNILSSQTGIINGSRSLSWISHKFDGNRQDDFQLFTLIDSDSDDLAIGPERDYWAKEQLAKQDIKTENFETFYKEDVLNTCRNLIRQLETEIVELTQDCD
ncbi:hypothetical protein GCM10028818_24150 [Spirosoma horti]